MRGRRSAVSGNAGGVGLQLLPLLDLLFATIGILVVVMLVQRITSMEVGRPYATDAVLACTGRDEAVLHSSPDAPPVRVELTGDGLVRALAGVAETARVNVLVAMAAACAPKYALFHRVARILSEEQGRLFRFAFVPAEPPERVIEDILRRWRGEGGNG